MYLTHDQDPDTPIEDTLGALDELVRAGKVGAIGASNVDGAGLAEALETSARCGLARFECVQNSYSLLDRDAERDVLPLCAEQGPGFTPFSPLAGGWLTGKYRPGQLPPPGSRMTQRPEPYRHLASPAIYRGLERLDAHARARGVDTATLALAWLLAHPLVTANYVARRFGIHSAMSAAEALRRCPHAVFVRPRHHLYREYSKTVWETVRGVVPTVERTGLDEGYLDVGEVADGFLQARAVA